MLLFALLRALIVAPSPAQRSGFAAVVAASGLGRRPSLPGGHHLQRQRRQPRRDPRGVGIYGIRRAHAVVLRSHRRRRTRPRGRRAGLKLPHAVFAVGFVPPSSSPPGRRFGLAFAFGFRVLGGMAAFAGPWMWYLWTEYDNPLFPYFKKSSTRPWAYQRATATRGTSRKASGRRWPFRSSSASIPTEWVRPPSATFASS